MHVTSRRLRRKIENHSTRAGNCTPGISRTPRVGKRKVRLCSRPISSPVPAPVKLDRLHHRGTGQRTHNIVFNKRSREFEDYRARCDFNSVNRSGGITKGAKQNSSILCIPLPRPQQLLLHQLERELKVQHRCSYVASNRMTSFQDSRFPSICVLKAEAARARSHLCCSASSKEAGRDAALAGISGCAFVQDCRACYFNEEGHACRAAAHGCCC